MDVIAHPFEQFLPGRSWSGISAKETATEPTTRSPAPEPVRPRRIRVREGGWCSNGNVRGRICAGEHPVGHLGVPDKGVPDEMHLVAQTEVNESVRRSEVVAVGPGSRMNEQPLQIVFWRNLVELFLDEGNVLLDLLLVSTNIVGTDCGIHRDRAVDGRADLEMVFVGALERGLVGGPGSRTTDQQRRHE